MQLCYTVTLAVLQYQRNIIMPSLMFLSAKVLPGHLHVVCCTSSLYSVLFTDCNLCLVQNIQTVSTNILGLWFQSGLAGTVAQKAH